MKARGRIWRSTPEPSVRCLNGEFRLRVMRALHEFVERFVELGVRCVRKATGTMNAAAVASR
jgi:hypothetical protein